MICWAPRISRVTEELKKGKGLAREQTAADSNNANNGYTFVMMRMLWWWNSSWVLVRLRPWVHEMCLNPHNQQTPSEIDYNWYAAASRTGIGEKRKIHRNSLSKKNYSRATVIQTIGFDWKRSLEVKVDPGSNFQSKFRHCHFPCLKIRHYPVQKKSDGIDSQCLTPSPKRLRQSCLACCQARIQNEVATFAGIFLNGVMHSATFESGLLAKFRTLRGAPPRLWIILPEVRVKRPEKADGKYNHIGAFVSTVSTTKSDILHA